MINALAERHIKEKWLRFR